MDVLLSIKPKYVKSIMEGNKRYEFRKTIFKNRKIDQAYIYSSSPVKKIVGKFDIGDILEEHPSDLWNSVKKYAGIDDNDFFSYFEGKSQGYAIEIKNLYKFSYPVDPWIAIPGFVPPQSYYYLNKSHKAIF